MKKYAMYLQYYGILCTTVYEAYHNYAFSQGTLITAYNYMKVLLVFLPQSLYI